jgi:hypothetical protein
MNTPQCIGAHTVRCDRLLDALTASCVAAETFKSMKVQHVKYKTSAEFKTSVQGALQCGQEPVLSFCNRPFRASPAASKKITSAQTDKGAAHIIQIQDVDWQNASKQSAGLHHNHAAVIGMRSLGSEVLHIKDSNFESPWCVASFDVMIPPDQVRVLFSSAAWRASAMREYVTRVAGGG